MIYNHINGYGSLREELELYFAQVDRTLRYPKSLEEQYRLEKLTQWLRARVAKELPYPSPKENSGGDMSTPPETPPLKAKD